MFNTFWEGDRGVRHAWRRERQEERKREVLFGEKRLSKNIVFFYKMYISLLCAFSQPLKKKNKEQLKRKTHFSQQKKNIRGKESKSFFGNLVVLV